MRGWEEWEDLLSRKRAEEVESSVEYGSLAAATDFAMTMSIRDHAGRRSPIASPFPSTRFDDLADLLGGEVLIEELQFELGVEGSFLSFANLNRDDGKDKCRECPYHGHEAQK